jgi:hypothetical protein
LPNSSFAPAEVFQHARRRHADQQRQRDQQHGIGKNVGRQPVCSDQAVVGKSPGLDLDEVESTDWDGFDLAGCRRVGGDMTGNMQASSIASVMAFAPSRRSLADGAVTTVHVELPVRTGSLSDQEAVGCSRV